MATITNQARITYSYGAVNAAAASNIATATLTEPLTGSNAIVLLDKKVIGN